jgi:glycosyltransferase involved in cell wall biosynthesis
MATTMNMENQGTIPRPIVKSNLSLADHFLPTITIVTPNRNGGAYLEQTIRSVLDQDYPQLEYFVVDGASEDNSVEIIKKYAPRLAGWLSEPDRGMYDAINKGFARSHGEIMAYLNSDDMYAPWTLRIVSELFLQFPQIEWLTSNYPSFWTKDGTLALTYRAGGMNRGWIRSGYCLPNFGGSVIQQETTFWRRSLWERSKGCVDARYRLFGDAELWLRFSQFAEPYSVDAVLGGFRVHGAQLTRTQSEQMKTESRDIAARYGIRPHRLLGMWWGVQQKFPWRLRQKINRWLPIFSKMFFVRFDVDNSEWKVEAV